MEKPTIFWSFSEGKKDEQGVSYQQEIQRVHSETLYLS